MKNLHLLLTRLLGCSHHQTALAELLDAAMQLLGADMGSVQLFNPHDNTLKIALQRGFEQDFCDHFETLAMEKGTACSMAMQRGERVVIEDGEQHPDFEPYRKIARSVGFRALQSTPLMSRCGRFLGVLSTHFRKPHRPSEQDLHMLDLYARQAADFVAHMQDKEALKNSEMWLRSLFNSVEASVLVVTPERIIVDVNAATRRIFGYSPWELRGLSTGVLHVDHEHYLEFGKRIDEAFKRGKAAHFQFEAKRKNGQTFPTEHSVSLLQDDYGESIGIVSIVQDITDRKRFEQALSNSEQFKNAILDSVSSHIAVLDINGVILSVNRPWVRFSAENGTADGLPARRTEPGVNYLEICRNSRGDSSEGAMAAHDGIRAVMDGELPSFTLEYPCHSPSLKRWFIMTATPLGTDQKGVVVSHTNITEQKLSEESLQLSEARFSTVFHSSPVSIAISGLNDHKFIDVNEAWLKLTGLTRKEAIGQTPLELNLWVNPNHRDRLLGMLREQNAVHDFEVRFRNKSGHIANILLSAELIELAGEPCVLSMAQDITERKRAEDLLREREEVYRAIVEQAAEGVVLIDLETLGFVEFNDAACDGLGYAREEFAHLTLLDLQGILTREEVIERLRALVKAGHATFENQHRRKDGTLRDVLISNRVISIRDYEYLVGMWQDITEQKRLEAEKALAETQLRQAQKMEALGTLAGGIAHDFNNILGIISGFTELVLSDLSADAQVSSELHEVLKAAGRAKDLVKQILAFSRQGEQEKRPVQVGLIIKEAMKMLRASLPATIELEAKVVSQAAVMGDPTQIHQVLMNLCSNSAHAMRGDAGVLQVALTDVQLGPESIPPHSGLRPGPHVKLTVQDSGHGIGPSILDRIFEPFFTTKESGIGTGLGLSVVHGIVKSHQGAITVTSLLGQGTTFEIFFPVIEAAVEASDMAPAPLPRGNERILVVDDEPALATAVTRMLEQLGYQVEFCTSGIDALEAVRRQSREKPFDLVITDMTMPRFTGADLAGELLKRQPAIAILLCTGFSEKIDEQVAGSLGIQGFLMKPVAFTKLAMMVRKVLDERVS